MATVIVLVSGMEHSFDATTWITQGDNLCVYGERSKLVAEFNYWDAVWIKP